MEDLEILKIVAKKLGRELVMGNHSISSKIVYSLENQTVTKLFLSYCNLTNETIPDELWDLKYLTELVLDNNQLLIYPKQISKFKRLKKLNLQNNQFKVIGKEIANLKNLEYLELSDNPLYTIPAELGKLTKLKSLRLLDSQISSLPTSVPEKSFPNLTILELDFLTMTFLPLWIFKLPSLQFLSLTGMHLNKFPTEIKLLSNLTSLFLDSTQIGNWPEHIELPPKLKFINLDGADLDIIPKAIIDVAPIYIPNQRSRIKDYPGLQISLGNLFSDLDENLLFSMDSKISNQYLLSLQENSNSQQQISKRLTEIKLVLLGPGATGKSSLKQRLCSLKPDDDNIPLVPETTTHGVNLDYHLILKNLEIEFDTSYDFTLRIWDFGGQQKYIAINKLLLTNNAIYIVILDSRTNTTIDFWLEIIHQYAPNSKILLVANKMDENVHTNINFEYYFQKYSTQLFDKFFKISCLYPSKGIDRISSIIDALKIIIQKNINQIAPLWNKNWANVKFNLEREYLLNNNVLITQEEFKNICIENNIMNNEDQKNLQNILNTCGTCITFENNQSNILNPSWIADYLYTLHNNIFKPNILLDFEEYLSITNNQIEYQPYAIELLNILESRGLCITVTNYENREVHKKIFSPIFLPEQPPDLWEFPTHNNGIIQSYIFKSKVPPDFEFQIFLTNNYIDIYNANLQVWQYGAFLSPKDTNTIALVTLENNNIIIKIWAESPQKIIQYFNFLKYSLFKINNNDFFKEFIIINYDNFQFEFPIDILYQLYCIGIETYYYPDKSFSNLIPIDILDTGNMCGFDNNDFGKNNNSFNKEYLNNIRKVGFNLKIESLNAKNIAIGNNNIAGDNSTNIQITDNTSKAASLDLLKSLSESIKSQHELNNELLEIIELLQKNSLDQTEKATLKERIQNWLSNAANVANITLLFNLENIKKAFDFLLKSFK